MRGIDTNVLVRFIVQDDKAQGALARKLIENRCSAERPAHLPLIVLCELAWVLDSAYGYSRDEIATTLRQVLMTDCFDIEEHALAWQALRDFGDGRADYADYLIARLNRQRGCDTTFTFDKKASAHPAFTLLAK